MSDASTWAIYEQAIPQLQAAYRGSLAATADARRAFTDATTRTRQRSKPAGKIAVLNLSGPLQRRLTFMGWLAGGMSTLDFGMEFDAAVADPSVSAVLIVVDSPGGEAGGTMELADKIFAARGKKPIIAIADTLAASAGYWIPSAASEFYVTPSGGVGSIGVWSLHLDHSEQLAKDGIKPTMFRAPPAKADMSPFEPLTSDAAKYEQQNVDMIYHQQFLPAVSRNRGVPVAKVAADFGQGRVVDAQAAKRAGMVDGVVTLDELTGRLMSRVSKGATAKSMSLWLPDSDYKLFQDHRRGLTARETVPAAKPAQPPAVTSPPALLGKVAGLAIAYNRPATSYRKDKLGTYIERVRPGAFRKSLAGSGEIVLTINHDFNRIVARRSDGSLRLCDGADGVRFEADLKNTPTGAAAYGGLIRGELAKCSFSTDPGSEVSEFMRTTDKRDARDLVSAELMEICLSDNAVVYQQTYAEIVR